jgi:DNA-binding response OmpR family regulator
MPPEVKLGWERMDVREQATSDDRLLDGEDPGTKDPEVVRRWIAVYAELIAFKQDLISRIELEHRAADPAAKPEVSLDLDLVKREKARLEGRLSFWRSRQLLLGDVMDEGGGASQRAFGDSALRLSRREAQLLAFFTRNAEMRFAANALATLAWHDHALSAAQVRNYVSRLRSKLQLVEAPCRIETVEGGGYRLVWSRTNDRPKSD